jgi:hypothetical protein
MLTDFCGFDTPSWSEPVGQLATGLDDYGHGQIRYGSKESCFIQFEVRRICQI